MSCLRREDTHATILALSRNGIPIKQIERQHRQSDPSREQRCFPDPGKAHSILHPPWLIEQWASGRRNGLKSDDD